MISYDLVVIGAGPAGMTAATQAAVGGASVAVLDEQPQLGGQIYRNVGNSTPQQEAILGTDYSEGRRLTENFVRENIEYISSAVVWSITDDGNIAYTVNGAAEQIQARFVLLANGALERPVPIPGWTTAGVMTAGAAQILLKASGIVSTSAVLAGSGPLIYLIAAQMCAAGHPPLAIVETQTWGNYFRAIRHWRGAISGRKAVMKGLGLFYKLHRAGVKRYTNANMIEVLGRDQVNGIRFSRGGHLTVLACSTVFLHQGVVPNTQISRALGIDHSWSDQQQCFSPISDQWGKTNKPRIYIAGDGAFIGGAKAAEYAGHLSALEILHKLGRLNITLRNELAKPVLKLLKNENAVRPFLDTLYAVPSFILRPKDPVIICRCEEVTAGDIRNYAKLGCMGPNQTKAFGRSGMGPCQGRYCSLTVTEILSQEHNLAPDKIGSYRIRMPVKPVNLGELASLIKNKDTLARRQNVD